MKILDIITESHNRCPHCGGPLVSESELMEKKDACYYKIKSSAKVWPSAYASGRLVQCRKKGAANYGNKKKVDERSLNEFAPYDHNDDGEFSGDDLDESVLEGENWSKHNNKRVGGMSKKSVSSYRRSHPGSKIQTAVTTKPSKLKKGSKSAKRRASFCARMRGMKKHRTGAKTAHDPNSNINKSLRRWHCESIEELHELVMLAEQYIRNNKK